MAKRNTPWQDLRNEGMTTLQIEQKLGIPSGCEGEDCTPVPGRRVSYEQQLNREIQGQISESREEALANSSVSYQRGRRI